MYEEGVSFHYTLELFKNFPNMTVGWKVTFNTYLAFFLDNMF